MKQLPNARLRKTYLYCCSVLLLSWPLTGYSDDTSADTTGPAITLNVNANIETTMLFAAIFAVLHVIFTLRVGAYRFRSRISLGDGGDNELRNRIRAHGNFVEQVPIALLLLLLNDLNGLDDNTLMILGSVLLVSRLLHSVMIVSRSLPIVLRPISMIGTLGTILASAILLLV